MYNVFSRPQALATGIDHSSLLSARRCCLADLARGVYAVRRRCTNDRHAPLQLFIDHPQNLDSSESLPPWEQQRHDHIGWIACSTRIRPDDVISHRSAALIHGIPLLSNALPFLEVSNPQLRRTSPQLRRRRRTVDDRDRVSIPELPSRIITNAARTAADLLRDGTAQEGVIAADAYIGGVGLRTDSPAYRSFPLAQDERSQRRQTLIDTAVRADGRLRTRARSILQICTGLSESPAESLALMGAHASGLADIRQQAVLLDADGAFVARVDLLIERMKLVLEVDGFGKYLTGPTGRSADRSALRREKSREDRIRALGYTVVRVTYADVVDPVRFHHVLSHAVQVGAQA